jgi:outer membrane protein
MKATLTIQTLMITGCLLGTAAAQTVPSDSISIDEAVHLTLQHHATVRQAEFDLAASEARTNVKRSDLYPDVSFDAGYSRTGPVPEFEIPGEGTIKVAPDNIYDMHLGLNQTLYDFGRTKSEVKLAVTSRQSSADRIGLIKCNLAYETIGVFNNIMILHRQIDVLDDELQTLRNHQEMSVKRLEAGTATDFDTLTVRVRFAVVKSERVDARHALETQEIKLRELTGLSPDVPINLRGEFATQDVSLEEDSLIAEALRQRPEITLAHDAEATARARLHLVSLDNKPKLALNFAAGLKNGYEPNLNEWRKNYMAGLQLSVPLFNGYKTKHDEAAAGADLNSARAHTSDVEQKIRASVRQAVAGVNASMEKTASAEAQVYQAEKAVSLANVRYEAGAITNLDLLDAETTLSEAKLIHLRALYNFTVSLVELDRAIGKKVW